VQRNAEGKGPWQVRSAGGSEGRLLRQGRGAGSHRWRQGLRAGAVLTREQSRSGGGSQGQLRVQSRSKGDSLSLKPAPGWRSSKPSLRFPLAFSFKATSYTISKVALSPCSHTPRRGVAHRIPPHQPHTYCVHSQDFFLCFCPAFVYHCSLSNLSILL